MTVDQAVALVGEADPVESLFEWVFAHKIRPVFEGAEPEVPAEEQRERAFFRYMIGQLCLFARYHFVPEAAPHGARIVAFLLAHAGHLGTAEIARVRAFFERFVELLASRNLISLDDEAIYREIFPLFEPFYVFYDGPPGDYESLDRVAARALDLPEPPPS
jgi:hypothetical protein